MRYTILILALIISHISFCQSIISKNKAIQIAIHNGIEEPIDTFEVNLIQDTIWEVKSLFCDDYHSLQSEIYRINAITGEKYEENIGVMKFLDWDDPWPKTRLNYDGYVDSLIPVNRHEPMLLVPDEFYNAYELTISPDCKWIAIGYQPESIAVVSANGKQYKKICDDCLLPNWTNRENILLYEKDHKHVYEHNVTTNESSQIMFIETRYLGYSRSSTSNWLAFVKAVPRQSEDPNALIIQQSYKNQAYDLFILNLKDGKERRITTEGYVSGPWWNSSGDTVFFYMDDLAHYAFVSDNGSINYGNAKYLLEISIRDYLNCVDGRFPYIHNCQILLVDLATMKPIKFFVKKRGRYDNVKMSSDGKYIVFTQEKQNKFKIYLIEDDK